MRRLTIEQRLDRRQIKNETGCWGWNGTTAKGYACLTIDHVPRLASRLMWVLYHGEIPRGLLVCHRCDNPLCTRLDHLFLGTPQDNMDDMVAKGRNRNQNAVRK